MWTLQAMVNCGQLWSVTVHYRSSRRQDGKPVFLPAAETNSVKFGGPAEECRKKAGFESYY